jgi:hypothetical protein
MTKQPEWMRQPGCAPVAAVDPVPVRFARDPAYRPGSTPDRDGLAVVTCHYNFAGFDAPVRNLLRFLRQMDSQGVPVYGLEMVLEGETSLMAGMPRWSVVEIDDRHRLWQKEAAMNAVVATLPPSVRAVALVDADLHFEELDWGSLAMAPALQPFSEAVWTDQRGLVELVRRDAATGGLDAVWATHPGFAWVIRRDFWTRGPGLYPWCVTGSGDAVLAAGLLGEDAPGHGAQAAGPRNLGLLQEWLDAARLWMDGARPGNLPGRIWHEWHGSRADRRYVERHSINAQIDAGKHLELDESGLLRWTAAAPKAVRKKVAAYFSQRKEDG